KRLSVLINESPRFVQRNRGKPLMKCAGVVEGWRNHKRAGRVYEPSLRARCGYCPGRRQAFCEVPCKLELRSDHHLTFIVDVSVLAVHLDNPQVGGVLAREAGQKTCQNHSQSY